jgi:hypothetical protein
MLLNFTDAMSGKPICINPVHVIAVLESPKTEEVPGNTVVNLITGTVALEEDFLSVVGLINGEIR